MGNGGKRVSAGTSNNDITVSNLGAGGPLAVTTVTSIGSTITDTDLAFNNYYSWSTSGAPGYYDVQNVDERGSGTFNFSKLPFSKVVQYRY